MIRTVFVTGAAGVMGSRLSLGLAAAGWRVRALVLPGDPLAARLSGAAIEIVEGDVTQTVGYRTALAGVDTIFHLAAVILSDDPRVFDRVNREGTRDLVRAAGDAGVRHFVYVSSASVTYPRLTRYGASKAAGESAVKADTRMQHTIVRPTLVWDDQGGGQELSLFRKHVTRGPVVPFVGRGLARKRPVHADDVARGLLSIAGNARALGRTYNFSGPTVVTLRQMARAEQAYAGTRVPLLPIPAALCQVSAWALERVMRRPPLTRQAVAGLLNDADLDPGDAMNDLDFRPRPYRQEMQ